MVRRLELPFVAPWRLVLAVQRNGLGPMVAFLILNLRRRGLVGAVGMAMARSRARRGSAAFENSDPLEIAPVSLLYLVRGPAGARRAFARTRRRIRLGARIQVLELEDGSAPVNLPAGPADRFVVFLRAGDRPALDLPHQITLATREGVAEVVSFDLSRREGGKLVPIPIPPVDPTCLRAIDYLFGRVALRGGAIARVEDWVNVDPRALILGWLNDRPTMQARGRWRHVRSPLVETAMTAEMIKATVRHAQNLGRRLFQHSARRVSVVICARDTAGISSKAITGLLAQPTDTVADVVIVTSGAMPPGALEKDAERNSRVRVIHAVEKFNRACLANIGACAGSEDYLLFLHEEIVPLPGDWLERLLVWFDDPAVGVVSPHFLGAGERSERESSKSGAGNSRLPEQAYPFSLSVPREAIGPVDTALIASRLAFEAAGGFDPRVSDDLAALDLCLRLGQSGFVNIFDPMAMLNAPGGHIQRSGWIQPSTRDS